jgi:hypothetical protein
MMGVGLAVAVLIDATIAPAPPARRLPRAPRRHRRVAA